MFINFNNRGEILSLAQRFKRFTRSSRRRKPWTNTTRTGKRTTGSVTRAAVDSVRDAVEARGGFTAMSLASGNERRRWHGTGRNCNIGDNGQTSFCSSPQCSLCCILRTSFDMARSKGGNFGSGIYTSSASSKFVTHSEVV